MRQLAGKMRMIKTLMIVLVTFVFLIHCADNTSLVSAEHNISMEFPTRAGETALDLVPNMRLFTFYKGTPNDKMFHQEALNITRNANKLSTKIESGVWNLIMVSSNTNFSLIPPVGQVEMQKLPMYKYRPVINGGKSSSAPQIFFQNKETPLISQSAASTMNVRLERVVAKVEVIVRKTSPNFKPDGSHKILLHNVPSTLTYGGGLYPDTTTPDTLAAPLQAPLVLESAGNGSLRGTETIEFIIPAHQGADFLSDAPADTIKQKMRVTVELERINGNRFVKQAEVASVAKCNKILRVYVDVNDGIVFRTEFLPWERVTIHSELGKGYRNWLYVKKGATGNGLSWSDPLPDMNTAIDKANLLIGQSKTVNGILVAGGSSRVYDEALDIPANLKFYGGWEGAPGTELEPNDTIAPYTSANRNLKKYKAYIDTGTGNVNISGDRTVFDGFVVSGSGDQSLSGLVAVSNATAWINAIEIKGQTINSANALALSDGTATNILVSDNSSGVSVTGNAKLINATVVNNRQASGFSGTLLNTIYWGNAGTVTASGTIRHSAFQETLPAGASMSDLYPLHTDNDAWLTSTNSLPGPHFNMTETATAPKYVAGGTNPDRAPMLGRGDQASFDNHTAGMPAAAKKDINGDPRHYEGTDIGCFENTANAGFKLEWNMKALYLSYKKGVESEHPALLFNNDVGAHVKWDIAIVKATDYTLNASYKSGSGSAVRLGLFKLTSTAANTTNNSYDRGSVMLSSNLGAYLPSQELKVFQTPGKSSVWNEGYVGSFHRWNETEERYIQGVNSGDWTARVINGIDWIKLDTHERGYNNGEVVETSGGTVSGTGNIVFRVGLKSKLTSSTSLPRYGLIIIQRTGGIALFFVRQGEMADYLYRIRDPRVIGNIDERRISAERISPYNLTDPLGRTDAPTLGKNGGGFVRYPSQNGYFFQWAKIVAYYPYGTTKIVPPKNSALIWVGSSEACPVGYHTPKEQAFVQSIFLARKTGIKEHDNSNFVYGRLADGFFDKHAKIGANYVNASNAKVSNKDAASYGLLMYNEFNNASVFFPIAGCRPAGKSEIADANYAWYWTSSSYSTDLVWNTHWDTGHIGMSCTFLPKDSAGSLRCFKD